MVKVAILTLSGCGGCEMSIADALSHEPGLLGKLEIQHWKLVHSESDIDNVDVLIISGAVSTEEEYEFLKMIEGKARKIIALGTCASFGGIVWLSDYWIKKKAIGEVYGEVREAPKPIRTRAVKDVIRVDFYISRCPPPHDLIIEVLKSLVEGKELPKLYENNVCKQCPRKIVEIKVNSLDELLNYFKKSTPKAGEVDPNIRFLSQGYLCLGSGPLLVAVPRAQGMGCHASGAQAPRRRLQKGMTWT